MIASFRTRTTASTSWSGSGSSVSRIWRSRRASSAAASSAAILLADLGEDRERLRVARPPHRGCRGEPRQEVGEGEEDAACRLGEEPMRPRRQDEQRHRHRDQRAEPDLGGALQREGRSRRRPVRAAR